MYDVRIEGDGGSIVSFWLDSPEAREWVHEFVELPDHMAFYGKDGMPYLFYAESRFAFEIAEGMADEGLTFE